ncbi:hypothetical protein D3C71_1945880 [compost metagenome]
MWRDPGGICRGHPWPAVCDAQPYSRYLALHPFTAAGDYRGGIPWAEAGTRHAGRLAGTVATDGAYHLQRSAR